MLKAVDEATLGRGGPMYEAAEQFYGGETDNRPKLIVTWGRPGVSLTPPTTITRTGAQLDWSAYVDPSTAAGDDIVEYQVHRSIRQTFTPGPDTLVAPVASTTRSYLDTTATPTPADSAQPFGNAFYYMVAVKTKDGELIPAPTQLVRLPKAGRVTKFYQNAVDTTLGSAVPDTNLDVYDGDPYVSPGNNSDYGVTRGLVKFPSIAGVPTGATIVDARLQLWAVSDFGATDGFVDVHQLTQAFDETTATWNKANATTPWTPGAAYSPTALDFDGGITNDPEWQTWLVNSTVKGWVTNPATNFGLLLKMRSESPAIQRVMLLSSEGAEPALRPKLSVTYLEKTAESTYYAPATPEELTAGASYPVDVTVINTTATTWTAASRALSYKWALPDGTDVTSTAGPVSTPLPQDVSPGESVTVHATLKAPPPSTVGNKREAYVPSWDLKNTSTGTWLSTSDGVPALAQNVAVADPTSDLLGLEKFYAYAGTGTGSGTAALANLYDGNVVWSYDALSNPSRGPATFVRLTYNSKDTSTSAAGFGWSLSTSSVMRMGSPLDFHPPGQDWPTEISLTDGDGTTHLFKLNKHGSTDPDLWDYDHPAGVHFHLQKTGNADTSRAWSMTRPDRTVFFFDADGYQTAIVDKNGNTLSFTYEARKSNNKPIKFLKYVTDATGRKTLTVDYYEKGQTYDYVDSGTGAKVTGATNLTNPKIIDQVESITDVSGRTVKLVYADKGLLSELTDGAGDPKAKVFKFGYDATQGNKNVKLVAVTDPRGHASRLAYYDAPTDPKFKWSLQTLTDRRNSATGFAYTDPDGATGDNIQTTVTDAENHPTTTRMDGFRRPVTTTDAKAKTSTLSWDTDHNVTSLQAPDTSVTKWTYDPKTGYPLTLTDAQAVADGTRRYPADLPDQPGRVRRRPGHQDQPRGSQVDLRLRQRRQPDRGHRPEGHGDGHRRRLHHDLRLRPGRPADHGDGRERHGRPATRTTTPPATRRPSPTRCRRRRRSSMTSAATSPRSPTPTPRPAPTGRTTSSAGRGQAKEPKDQAGNVFVTTPAPVFDAQRQRHHAPPRPTAPSPPPATTTATRSSRSPTRRTPPTTRTGSPPTPTTRSAT